MSGMADMNTVIDRIRVNPDGRPTALGAFIFAGGFSLGMEEAGFRVVGHLELPELALGSDVSKQRWPVLLAPLNRDPKRTAEPSWESFIQECHSQNVAPDVLYCNPPCVAYAKQGARKGLEDERMCYVRYAAYDLALKLRPKVWTWELVEGIYDDDPEYLESMANDARAAGYRVYAFLTTAANHGGFQNRRRYHFVASKVDLNFDGIYDSEPESRRTWRTLGDALDIVAGAVAGGPVSNNEVLTSERNNLLKIIPFCPPGAYLRNVHDEVMRAHYTPRGKEWNGVGRAGVTQARGRRDRLCPVIVGGHTVIHPDEDRFLTIRENATVMGFPTDYRFSRGTTGYQEVGRGLCTHTAAFLGRVIEDGIRRGVGVATGDSTIIVDWRDRQSIPSLPTSDDDKKAWWQAKHPDLPVEWAVGKPAGKVGRPVGWRKNRGPEPEEEEEQVTTAVVVGWPDLADLLMKVGVQVLNPGTTADTVKASASADVVVITGTTSVDMMILGAACTGDALAFTLRECPVPTTLVSSDAITAATTVCEAVGIEADDLAKVVLASMTPMELLALMKARQAG